MKFGKGKLYDLYLSYGVEDSMLRDINCLKNQLLKEHVFIHNLEYAPCS